MALQFNAKFMEISVGINHRIDDLLVGIMHQVRKERSREEVRGGRRDSIIIPERKDK